MITKKLERFEELVKQFSGVAISSERDSYAKMVREFRTAISIDIATANAVGLNATLNEMEEEIGVLIYIMKERKIEIKERECKIPLFKKIDELKDILREYEKISHSSKHKQATSVKVRLDEQLTNIILDQQDSTYIMDAVGRIEGELDSVIGLVKSKSEMENKND